MLCLTGPVAAEVRIVTTEEPPTNFTQQGQLLGITTDIVNAIRKELGIHSEIEVKPWARSYLIAKANPNVAIFTAGQTEIREMLGFHFVGPVVSRKHGLWARKDNDYAINQLSDVKKLNLKVGAMRDDWRALHIKEQGILVEEVPAHVHGLKMLLRKRTDLWISSNIEAPVIAQSQQVDMDRIKMVLVFKEAPSYIMLSKGTQPEVVKAWQAAFSKLQQSGFMDQLAEKWSKNLGYKLVYHPEQGIHLE